MGIDDFCEREYESRSDTFSGDPEDYESETNSPNTSFYFGVNVRVGYWRWCGVDINAGIISHIRHR